jgi:hypothetical protein
LKRFKSKNPKVKSFCLELMDKALTEKCLTTQDVNLKLIFNATNDLLSNSNKDVREYAIQLVTFVYVNCEDDINTFCSNLKNLRPVQLKELKDSLANNKKENGNEYQVKLFDKVYH